MYVLTIIYLYIIVSLYTAIKCPALSDLTNGAIVYDSDTNTTFLYDFGTNATHTCNSGYSLVGDEIRTCGGDGTSTTGEWNLSKPSCCQRKLILSTTLI